MSIEEAYRHAEEQYANEPPFINNDVFRLFKKIKEYENNGNINEATRAQLELASILNKRVLQLRNYFRDNNIDSANDFDKPGVQARAEDWLKNRGWWIPVRDDLNNTQNYAWNTNVTYSYGELYNYLPDPQYLLNVAYNLNIKAMETLIQNSGINRDDARRIFNMWKETNPKPRFEYEQSERSRRAAAAERRRGQIGGRTKKTKKN